MLELRSNCEHCNKTLTPDNQEAMICSFECTFCNTCVEKILKNVCPNCGGGFVPRPIRPKSALAKHPAKQTNILGPMNQERHSDFLKKYEFVKPEER